VIYTSGSTGTPKGVLVSHANVIRLFTVTEELFRFCSSDTWTMFHSYAFDFSVWEIWGAFIYGSRLVVVPHFIAHSPSDFLRLLITERVTVLNQVPSALDELLRAMQCDGALVANLKLRFVICGGEELPSRLVEEWRAQSWLSDISLINMYGITETTVHVTYMAVNRAGVSPGILVPAGKELGDLKLYVLDDTLQLVRPGATGEIYVAGSGVARGYLNRPALTSQRFVANPFGEGGSRMYRSGDIGRWVAKDVLQVLGRADQQVKIRGFRIELHEIEAALIRSPQVREAVVCVREGSVRQRQLAAYVVAERDVAIDVPDLRRHLAESLPGYMLPGTVTLIEELPLTPSGKLDRMALPDPGIPSAEDRRPGRMQEEILAELFADVLGLESVGVEESFFGLGGNSLLAARLATRVRLTFKQELPVRTIFEAPTVVLLARQILGPGDYLPAIRTTRVARHRDGIPLSFAQMRLWFTYRMEGPTPLYNIPFALRLVGELNPQALQQAFGDIVERHGSLRTIFPMAGDSPVQRVLDPSDSGEFFVHRKIRREDLDARVVEAASYAFDLAMEIPFRVWLFGLEGGEHALVLVTHHIASDGLSIGPLMRDLGLAYAARSEGRRPNWEPLPVQYVDYALWQKDLLGDHSDPESLLSRHLTYWTEILKNCPDEINLPRDYPATPDKTYQSGSVRVTVNSELHRRLSSVLRSKACSLLMLTQAAVGLLLAKSGAGEDILCGTPVAGRMDEALDGLIGFFVNTIVLRTHCVAAQTLNDMLESVRDSTLNAYAHQDLPFELLVEHINPIRSSKRHPLFQVMLNFRRAADIQLSPPFPEAHPIEVGSPPARFDLTFNFTEHRRGRKSQGIDCEIVYASDVFERSTVEQLGRRLVKV
ncbi:MAG: AMP-binding protein, partial [Acidobacteria bacterium]|nr:AMP-binding protein [Acidobacteriota bacterium]